jgi:cytochrome c peroxidase
VGTLGCGSGDAAAGDTDSASSAATGSTDPETDGAAATGDATGTSSAGSTTGASGIPSTGGAATGAAATGSGGGSDTGDSGDGAWEWTLPDGVAPPPVPADNPMSAAKVELGRRLFYDVRLAQNSSQSCGSCHVQALAFADGRDRPVGSTGELHPRNSQGLVNTAYAARLTWANPVLATIERQIPVPMFGESPVELGITDIDAMLARLAADPAYAPLVAAAFPDAPELTLAHVIDSLACFVRALVSFDSPYDRWLAGDAAALSDAAIRGEALFFSERLRCGECHSGRLLQAGTVDSATTDPPEPRFENTGQYSLDPDGRYPYPNFGLFEFTAEPADMGRFRPPSLRNVALTGPYMHDGSVATLEAVIRNYAAGGRQTAAGPNAGDGRLNPHKSPLVTGFAITDAEVADVVAFLEALTDPAITTDPRFSDPFVGGDRPGGGGSPR